MEMTSTRTIAAPLAKVWAALNDPQTLKACLPGCELIEPDGVDAYRVVMAAKVGPVSARFTGRMQLADVEPMRGYTLRFDGQGGAAGFASFFAIHDPKLLIVSEIGIGIAWASILAMPYAILASSLPQRKLGIYMGLFNVFIVVPQLLVATVMGSIMKTLFPGQPIWTMLAAAIVMSLAALAMLRVRPA